MRQPPLQQHHVANVPTSGANGDEWTDRWMDGWMDEWPGRTRRGMNWFKVLALAARHTWSRGAAVRVLPEATDGGSLHTRVKGEEKGIH